MSDAPRLPPLPDGVLTDLEHWARLSGWTRHHLRAVERFWRHMGEPSPLRILDVGCGHGGLLEELSSWAERMGIDLELLGVEQCPDLAERARNRLGGRATVLCRPLNDLGLPSGCMHLVTCALLLHRLSSIDRIAVVRELRRVARTAYLFDVTPSVAGEVGARLIPWLTGLHHAPPEAWVQTLERAPSPSDLAHLVRHLPVRVVRVFPSAICTEPEPAARDRVSVESTGRVRYSLSDLPPGLVGAERCRLLDPARPLG
ncbi:MAG: class I SAM-dependent methyltransferase [Deltaproteobacteria bacterium]|nr:MAG: class I SAM-dependent methyltransferase [Deltaproteobacteria bacterium]